MIYYINRVNKRFPGVDPYNQEIIGLFTNDNWYGAGNFCGWYGAEYYSDTTLLAYYVVDNESHSSIKFQGADHVKEVISGEYYSEICIGSIYMEYILEASNDEEAVRKFFKEDFMSRFEFEQYVKLKEILFSTKEGM